MSVRSSWAAREIVSAADSDVKFIVTDHPVTVYNAAVDPTSPQCAYPQDPIVATLGTQTVFAPARCNARRPIGCRPPPRLPLSRPTP